MEEKDHEKVLDVIDLSFKAIDRLTRSYDYIRNSHFDQAADAAIAELNTRFREHAVGYEFDGKIIRVDSQMLHAEAVKPALMLLRQPG